MVLVMEPRLIAVEKRERAMGAGERVEGDSQAMILGDVIVIAAEALFLIVHTVLEESGFDAGVTRDTPMRGGELMDEIDFGFGLRAEVVEIIVKLRLILLGGFIEEYDGLGGESVSEGVEGGLFRRAAGLGGVGAGGRDLAAGGGHDLLIGF